MKRILVIDESEVVRETLALILGREFAVSKRPLGTQGLPRADSTEEVDLLILGISPQHGLETANLVRFAAQLPFAVLLLVDSQSTARSIGDRQQVGCLAKPFNPYELQEKVGQLLARRSDFRRADTAGFVGAREDYSRFLDFPYLNRSAASLVRRFAAINLPVLIYGERGCGQQRVAWGVQKLHKGLQGRLSINAVEIGSDYLTEKSEQLSYCAGPKAGPFMLAIENLEQTTVAGQSLLLNFILQEEEKLGALRLVTTANADLLEQVYRGDFLEDLYYKLATLTLKLAPLRERREDVPLILEWFAAGYARMLGKSEPVFSEDAINRLINYLWFGNLREMETVVARTVALRSGGRVEAADLVFDFGGEGAGAEPSDLVEFVPPEGRAAHRSIQSGFSANLAPGGLGGSRNGPAKSVDLNIVIHELAHELKNPMVTIKTFAQLLGERYQDENFRARFQEVVGDDIERMDDLLEVMIKFADFTEPRRSLVALEDKLRAVLGEIHHECAERQIGFLWKGNGAGAPVRTDETQLIYILKNVFLAILCEAKLGSEIEIDLGHPGALTIAYRREGARVASITHYLTGTGVQPSQSILPLRVLLAKQLLERNGGRLAIDQTNPDIDIVRMEFTIAEHGKEN